MDNQWLYKVYANNHKIEDKINEDNPHLINLLDYLLYGTNENNDAIVERLVSNPKYDLNRIRIFTNHRILSSLDHGDDLYKALKELLDRAEEEISDEDDDQDSNEDDDQDSNEDDDQDSNEDDDQDSNEDDDQDSDEDDDQDSDEDDDQDSDEDDDQDSDQDSNEDDDQDSDQDSNEDGDQDSDQDGKSKNSKGKGKEKESNKGKEKEGVSSEGMSNPNGYSIGDGPNKKPARKSREKKIEELVAAMLEDDGKFQQKLQKAIDKIEENPRDISSEIMGASPEKYSDEYGAFGFSKDEIAERNALQSRLSGFRASDKMKRFLDAFGDLHDVMHEFKVKNDGPEHQEITGIMLGKHIPSVLPSQKVLLSEGFDDEETNEMLETLFQLKYATRQLLQFEKKGKKKRGKGDLALFLDVSGSMASFSEINGRSIENYVTGFAISMAIMIELKKQGRHMSFHTFENRTKRIFNTRKDGWKNCFDKTIYELENLYMGGTCFDTALKSYIREFDENEKHVDLMFITDMNGHVSHDILENMVRHKRQKEVKTFCLAFEHRGEDRVENTLASMEARLEEKSPHYELGCIFDIFLRTSKFSSLVDFSENVFSQ